MSRDSSRVHDDEGLLTVPIQHDYRGTVGIELLRDLLKIFSTSDRLIIDCLDYIAGL